jgi:putative ABC transport system permease protein
MLRNYLKTALRVFQRDRAFALLNVAGLALGMACFALLMMWVREEAGWDRFHEHAQRLYRVQSSLIDQPGAVAPTLKDRYPKVVDAARYYFSYSPLAVQYQEKIFDESCFAFADPSFLKMFTIPFVA